ncbi:hypothetical protein PLICRDRAFT_36296 [Plicaturopsis crispa FD-325 SS-3]|nr:hypothetical protein PLICRDRAFT_36296 [Plicaturopsis crispa FD-325 SS-3]
MDLNVHARRPTLTPVVFVRSPKSNHCVYLVEYGFNSHDDWRGSSGSRRMRSLSSVLPRHISRPSFSMMSCRYAFSVPGAACDNKKCRSSDQPEQLLQWEHRIYQRCVEIYPVSRQAPITPPTYIRQYEVSGYPPFSAEGLRLPLVFCGQWCPYWLTDGWRAFIQVER